MPYWFKFILLALFLLFLIGSTPLAMQFYDGSLEGFITDDRGPLPNASIEARNVMSGAELLAVSDAAGHYRIGGMHVGRYSLWVRADQHSPKWIPRVAIESGQTTRQDVFLSRANRIPTITSR